MKTSYKKLGIAIIFSIVSLPSYSKEEKLINMPFVECVTQARNLASKGKELQEVKLRNLMIFTFRTTTDYYTVACGLIGRDADYMSIIKETNAERKENNLKAESEQAAKTKELSKLIGLE